MTIQRLFSLVLIIFLVGLTAFAAGTREREQISYALDAPVPLDSQVITGRLDNGLTYYVRANGKPENRAILRLAVDAGSILETNEQLGLAHFAEHMAFNGTEEFEKQRIIDYLETIGMQFGPDINAHTGFDETVYKLNVPLDNPEYLETGLEVLEEWAHRISFEPEEIDKERGVIVEEWRIGRGAGARMRDEYLPVLFRGSRYAERLPIGKMEVVRNFDYPVLTSFYDRWYRPDLMAIVAVGDFDPEEMVARIRDQFDHIPARVDPAVRREYPVPDHEETLYSVVTDPEADSTSVELIYKHAVQHPASVADLRAAMITELYTLMLNQRFSELAQAADPPFVNAGSSFINFVRTKAIFDVYATVPEDGIVRGLETLVTEVERADRHGFLDSELERAKSILLRRKEQEYNERETTESVVFAERLVRTFLDDQPTLEPAYEYQVYRRYLPQITLTEVNRRGSELITRENRMVLVTAPAKPSVTVPTQSELATLLARTEGSDVEPWEDTVSEAPLLDPLPAPAPVVREVAYPEIGVTEWKLANGVTVVLKPTEFKNDEVLLTAFSPGGTSVVSDDEHVAATTASNIAYLGGVGELSRTDLNKYLAGKVVQVFPEIGNITEGFSGNSSPQDLETMLQLVYLYFTEPRITETAFQSYMTRMAGLLENREASPEAQWQDAIQLAISQDHPRRQPLTLERLQTVQLDDVRRVFESRFSDADEFTFVMVGAFDLQTIRPLVERYLGGLPASDRNESWRDLGIDPPDETVDRTVRKGIEPKSIVGVLFPGEHEYSRENNYQLRALATALEIKLREEVREQASGSYFVSVNPNVSQYPDEEYRLDVLFACDPQRVEELTELVFQSVRSVQESGLEPIYATKVKEIQTRAYEEDLETNRYWLEILESYYLNGLDPTDIVDYPVLVSDLDAEALRRAARDYIDLDRYVRVVLRPEAQEQE